MYTYVKYVKYIKIFNIFEKILHRRRLIISYLLVTSTLLKLYWTRMRLKPGSSNNIALAPITAASLQML